MERSSRSARLTAALVELFRRSSGIGELEEHEECDAWLLPVT
jgi:hypothetical protein